MTRGRAILAAALVAAFVVVAVVLYVVRGNGHGGNGVTTQDVTIPGYRGVQLAAEVTKPSGGGDAPLVIMPTSWGSAVTEYRLVAAKLAESGYVVVSYVQRGFTGSPGTIDLAGDPTQRDVSAVIDWALKHTHADPQRIGVEGISYGAGIALLAAERDPRIKAVVALSGWSDWAAALAQNDTFNLTADRFLFGPGYQPRLATELNDLATTRAVSDPAAAISTLRRLSPSRSPISDVAALNRNHTAVMLANGFEDSIFPPGQLVTLFDALHGPKRLELLPGDHTGPERAGLGGLPGSTTDDGQAWLDRYLRGLHNGVADGSSVRLRDIATGAWHDYHSWPTKPTVTTRLGAPSSAGAAALITKPAAWTSTIRAGTDTTADSGAFSLVPSSSYKPPVAELAGQPAAHGWLWSSPVLGAKLVVSGSATWRVALSASTSTTTIYAYLYDIAPTGVGRLMSVTPYTATGLRPGKPRHVSLQLNATCWTIAAGDRLALVVDTVDPRYHSSAPTGSTVTLASTSGYPATLVVPFTR